MPSLRETYVGVGARWAVLKVDYPAAEHKEELVPVEESDIPERFRKPRTISGGGHEEVTHVCKCTLTFGAGSGIPPVVAYRFPDDWEKARSGNTWYCMTDDSPGGWETWCSKTLGRALKEAGIPQDTKEIQLWLLYRRRMAEADSIRRGVMPAALASMPQEEERQVIERAGSSEEQPEPEQSVPATVSDETLARVNALPDEARRKLDDFLEQREWDYPTLDAQNGQGNVCRAFLANLEKQTQPDRPQPDGTAEPAQPASQPPPAHMPNEPPSMVSESAKSGVWAAVQEAAVDEDQFCERLHAAGIPTEVDLPWTAEQLWAASRIADQMIAAKRPPTAQPRSAKRPAGRADLEAMIGGWDKPKVVSELNARKLPTAGRIDDLRDRLYRAMISDQPAEQAS